MSLTKRSTGIRKATERARSDLQKCNVWQRESKPFQSQIKGSERELVKGLYIVKSSCFTIHLDGMTTVSDESVIDVYVQYIHGDGSIQDILMFTNFATATMDIFIALDSTICPLRILLHTALTQLK